MKLAHQTPINRPAGGKGHGRTKGTCCSATNLLKLPGTTDFNTCLLPTRSKTTVYQQTSGHSQPQAALYLSTIFHI
jgi:uncharacterized protein YceK